MIALIGLSFFVNSQNKINIELHAYISSSDRPLKFALVYLIDNKDTICQTTTDQFGMLNISDLVVTSDSLKCIVRENDPRYVNQQVINLKCSDDIYRYQLEIGLLKRLFDNFDTGAYFKENEFRNFENFEIYGFRKKLDEMPHLCIKMNLRQLPNESKRLAKKRIKQFENYLFSQGVNMKQVLFTSDIQLVQFIEPKTIYEDWETPNPYLNSPGFQPMVYSMEGPCR